MEQSSCILHTHFLTNPLLISLDTIFLAHLWFPLSFFPYRTEKSDTIEAVVSFPPF